MRPQPPPAPAPRAARAWPARLALARARRGLLPGRLPARAGDLLPGRQCPRRQRQRGENERIGESCGQICWGEEIRIRGIFVFSHGLEYFSNYFNWDAADGVINRGKRQLHFGTVGVRMQSQQK